jgi:ATP-dependent DNA helicase RecG
MSSDHPLLLEIQKGESQTLEFKEQLPKGQQVAKTLIAFANTSGGKLVVGVSDDRQLVGIQDDIFELQDQITSMINELCMPNILPYIYIENIQGIELLVIEVSRGSLLPYYLKPQGKAQGTYIRLGASNRVASPEYIQQLELQRLNQTFDEQPNPQYSLDDIDLQPLKQAFAEVGKELSLQKMRNLKLIIQQNGQDYPSHGLLILLGLYEQVEIKCSRFKGTTMTVFLDKKEYRGDLFSQLKQTEQFIKNHLHLRADFVMANPPFNIKDWWHASLESDVRWKYGTPPQGNANFAWMQHMLHHLSPTGSMALLLANGSMSSNTNNEGEIRKNLIEADLVECIVALPGQLFTNTLKPTCIF